MTTTTTPTMTGPPHYPDSDPWEREEDDSRGPDWPGPLSVRYMCAGQKLPWLLLPFHITQHTLHTLHSTTRACGMASTVAMTVIVTMMVPAGAATTGEVLAGASIYVGQGRGADSHNAVTPGAG